MLDKFIKIVLVTLALVILGSYLICKGVFSSELERVSH